jgi:hypothetical protein
MAVNFSRFNAYLRRLSQLFNPGLYWRVYPAPATRCCPDTSRCDAENGVFVPHNTTAVPPRGEALHQADGPEDRAGAFVALETHNSLSLPRYYRKMSDGNPELLNRFYDYS